MSDRRFRLKPFIALEGDRHDPEGILVDTHSATMCSCNETAWMLLNALSGGAGLGELVDLLAEAFDVTEADARRDATEFIHRLAAMGLTDEIA